MNSAHVLSILHPDETKCAWVKSAASSELMMIQLLAGHNQRFPLFPWYTSIWKTSEILLFGIILSCFGFSLRNINLQQVESRYSILQHPIPFFHMCTGVNSKQRCFPHFNNGWTKSELSSTAEQTTQCRKWREAGVSETYHFTMLWDMYHVIARV